MESDKILEEYKQDIIYATHGLRKKEDTYVAGALIIKHNNKINIIASGTNPLYKYLHPDHFLYHQIIEKYKNEYEIVDLHEIADDFNENSIYKDINKIKFDFNPTITEYIGELDLIISEWRFKILEKNNLLSNEFTKKKDTTTK